MWCTVLVTTTQVLLGLVCLSHWEPRDDASLSPRFSFTTLFFLRHWNTFVPPAYCEVIWPTLGVKASFTSEVYLCSLLISWRQLQWDYLAPIWLQTETNRVCEVAFGYQVVTQMIQNRLTLDSHGNEYAT